MLPTVRALLRRETVAHDHEVRRVEAHATSYHVDVYALKLEGAADEARLSSLIAKERDAFVRLIDERRLLAATSDMERHQSTKPKKARAIRCSSFACWPPTDA